MIKAFVHSALFVIALLPLRASADPIKLKLSLITSDRTVTYQALVRPFVDAVNAEARGLLDIEIYFSGALGKEADKQPQMVVDGVADIAFISPGYTPERFYDDTVIELPGLFQDAREASFVYTRLVATGAIKGYEEFFVIAAVASPPENIQARRPIAAIADLKGMTIRTNNRTEAAALEKLGMRPVVMPVNLISEAMSNGTIDGATLPPAMLFEFGVGRIASDHFLLDLGSAPFALVMNRKIFNGLPSQAQDIIRKYSGEWPIARFLETYEALNSQVMEKLSSNPRRKVTFPSQSDLDTAHLAFQSVVEDWVAKSPHNREQFGIVEAEIAKLRASR